MKLKTRIILGFTMIILMPLLLFAATLYGFSQSQAQKAQAVTESDGTVYDISITDSADSQGRVHVMAKDLFISAFVILISVALVVGLWVYRSIAVPLVKLKKATQNIKEGNLDFVLDVEGKDEFSELCQDFEEMRRRLKESTEEKSLIEKENRELISNISHDLKTPITAVKGYVEGIMDGVADPFNREYKVDDDKTELLEEEISRLEELFPHSMEMRLPGQCRLSAEIDVARTVARRAERALAAVSVKFGADNGAKKYMNRLADYLYVLARYEEAEAAGQKTGASEYVENDTSSENTELHASGTEKVAGGSVSVDTKVENSLISGTSDSVDEAVIQAVLRRMGMQNKITLDGAKKLIGKIEQEALRRGKKAVIAVCGPEGNPIAVHVMDGAFLVSFDVALKKAYTSVAVKMSTMELSKLAQPGGTFYGVDKMDGGKIVIFGGGVPLKSGDTIIGGLGISGGTGEEDHSLAEYALSVLPEIL